MGEFALSVGHAYAAVAQSVEHFIGNEEVRQFNSAQQLQIKFVVMNKEREYWQNRNLKETNHISISVQSDT